MEPWALVIIIAIAVSVGMITGILWMSSVQQKPDICETYGTILIETSDPDGPFLFLDLDRPIEEIAVHETVTFKVDTNGVTNRE